MKKGFAGPNGAFIRPPLLSVLSCGKLKLHPRIGFSAQTTLSVSNNETGYRINEYNWPTDTSI